MKVIMQSYINDFLFCHEKLKDIHNVVVEDMNVDLGYLPFLFACCYEMNEILKKQRIEIAMLISDVVYEKKDMKIIYSFVTQSDENYDIDTSCIEKYEKLAKSYCALCADELTKEDIDGHCSMHDYLSHSKIDAVNDGMNGIKLRLYELISKVDLK